MLTEHTAITATSRRFRAAITLIITLAWPSLPLYPNDQRTAVQVVVSVAPLATFADQVGGARVAVQTLVRPGHNPHLYEPTPRQITALAGANLFIRAGMPFEAAWLDRIRSVNTQMSVLDVRVGISSRNAGGHAHGDLDPHAWTSPPLAKHMARRIRDALIDLDPQHQATYRAGFASLAQELDTLDREIRHQLASIKNRFFLVYHPAWGYFADTYGLTQVAVEHEGKEPGPRRVKELIDFARRVGIRLIMVQPQFTDRTATTIAQAIGGRIATADPLAMDYFENMRRVVRLIADTNTS